MSDDENATVPDDAASDAGGRIHIVKSAELRGAKDYAAAMSEIEDHLETFDDDTLLPALLQGFYAARDSGDVDKAKEWAEAIAAEAPDMPSIQDYLG